MMKRLCGELSANDLTLSYRLGGTSLRNSLWDAMELPRLLNDCLHPVPFVWIPAGPPHQKIPPLAEDITLLTYKAFQRKEIGNSGFNALRWGNGEFKVAYMCEVDMRVKESFEDFEARMQERESEVVEKVVSAFLDGRAPIPVSK